MNEGGGAREPAEFAGSGDSAQPRTPGPPGVDGAGTEGADIDVPGLDGPGPDDPGLDDPGPDDPGLDGPGLDGPGLDGPGPDGRPVRLPVLPGFREMALRRMSQDRRRLMRELAGRRQDAGLSQTEIAARMGTSQSAVARLEAGEADVRASTLERYAAALGTEITWKLQG
jgi:DNA-binding XRE family transcriptional regulator